MQKIANWLFGKSRHRPPPRKRLDLGGANPGPLYAIGDVHGCIDVLRHAEGLIHQDMKQAGIFAPVILLGDYVDRGPASAAVLDHLSQPSDLGLRRIALCGNHDDLFLRFLGDPEKHMHWLSLGGDQTLLSYGIDIYHLMAREQGFGKWLVRLLAEAVPQAHREFLQGLPVSLKIGNTLFVHAGIRPGLSLDQQNDDDMMWIREPFLARGPDDKDLLVVHGHTPRLSPDVGKNRIGIDTGAWQTGRLAVLKLDGNRSRFLA